MFLFILYCIYTYNKLVINQKCLMAFTMKNKTLDKRQIKIDLIRAMLTHVPFDGLTWDAMVQGAIDISF